MFKRLIRDQSSFIYLINWLYLGSDGVYFFNRVRETMKITSILKSILCYDGKEPQLLPGCAVTVCICISR